MPPAPLRRPVTITLWLILSLLALGLSPVLLAVGELWALATRRPHPRLLARFLISYFARELSVLLSCGWLWLRAGFGLRIRSPDSQGRHRRLLHWFVHGLTSRALALLRLEVAAEPEPEAEAALAADRPLLLLSRHAGPGDTAIIVDQLLTRYRRHPSVVFKETLALDPSVDLIGHRLPHALLDTTDPEECEARIAEVSAGLPPRGVLVLFPEGGNFTPERRRRALRKLWRTGRRRQAAAGEAMRHVMPPYPGGALAAMRASPDADVVFAAHTGLGLAAFPLEMWREIPIGATLRSHMWLAPAAERPRDPEAQVAWLYGWWKRIDGWLADQEEDPATATR